MLLAMLFHASLNASIVPFASEAGRWPGTLLAIAVALAVVACAGRRHLGKQPRFRWSTDVKVTRDVS
jgi:TRAP-type C4-dicarboxylate transport system permease large subunit